MRKKLLFLAVAVILSLSVWAESPQECHKKHPKAMCMFFNTPKYEGELENFDIERIAIYPVTQRVAIKTTQRDKDIIKGIKDMWHEDDGTLCIIFTDGSGLAFYEDKLFLAYLSTKKDRAFFKLDEYRQEMYEGIVKKYNTEER